MKAKVLAIMGMFMLTVFVPVSAKSGEDGKKDKSKVTFLVSVTCEKCQKHIEENLSFEKGVTGLDVNLPEKTVTIEYREDKTSPETLKKAIGKLGYTAMPMQRKTEGKETGSGRK